MRELWGMINRQRSRVLNKQAILPKVEVLAHFSIFSR